MQSPLSGHARALRHAAASGRPIPPLTASVPGLSVEDAYGIQRENVATLLGSGRVVVGRKIGLTSAAMQTMLRVEEPDFGVLLDDMVVEEDEGCALDSLIAPRVEAEIAFLLERDLSGPGVTGIAAAGAIAGAMPALEVIDSRVADWKITIADTVADNASSARFVVGSVLTPIDGLDLRLLGMVLERNGEVVATAAGAAVLGSPLRCLAWLANKLAEFGEGLHAGDIVLSGALHGAIDITDGDVFRAEFAHLGSVTGRFFTREADDGA
jgi:2-keto-4-pentenoate hydratase